MTSRYPTPDSTLYKKLIESYFQCLRNKQHVKKTTFHINYEKTIHNLALDIQNRTYRPGLSNIFVVTYPKAREVIAANLRDRIVHHFLYNYMAPYWERRFAHGSYACRPKKGPLKASQDLRLFIEKHQRGTGGKPLWYLKIDLQNFFPSIDHNILYGIISRHLTNELYLWLCRVIIFHRSTAPGNYQITSPKHLWQRLPKYKSLFHAPENKGLPIGNLTSQFYANVYLNEVDQFITHTLKGKYLYWQRYVDDILFLHEDPAVLKALVPQVQSFLQIRLAMSLNARKTLLQPLSRGLDHLGYFHSPNRVLVRQRIVRNCKSVIYRAERNGIDDQHLSCSLNSFMGYFRQCNAYNLRRSIGEKLKNLGRNTNISVDVNFEKVIFTKPRITVKDKIQRENILREQFDQQFLPRKKARKNRKSIRYKENWRAIGDILIDAEKHFETREDKKLEG